MITPTIWYKKIGSDESLIPAAIAHARVTGSIGATEAVMNPDGTVEKEATVRREGHQGPDYILI